MGNVISADFDADKHYRHSGFSSTITDSYTSPGIQPWGITWDGDNVISADQDAAKHYKHSGFSSTITASYASPDIAPNGITWDGDNVISAGGVAYKHYKHSGFSATITNSYSATRYDTDGLTWDGNNVIGTSSAYDKHCKHSGFSSTITASYSTPAKEPRGVTWDGDNVISADLDADKHYKHSGFSSTITDSYTSPGSRPMGITWDERYANEPPSSPTSLLCEGQINPTGVTDFTPEFSAIYNDPDSGDIATHAQIQVDDDSSFASPIWDSGWLDISDVTEGSRCADISYAGPALSLNAQKYYWRIRFKDDDGAEGSWSTEEAYFIMAGEQSCSLDALLKGVYDRQVQLDALLKLTSTRQAQVDAGLKGTLTIETNLDASLKGTQVRQASLDVVLKKQYERQAQVDADLKGTLARQAQVDADLKGTLAAGALLDALLKKRYTRQAALDAQLVWRLTAQASLDALLQATCTKSASLDALLKTVVAKSCALDALLQSAPPELTWVNVYDSDGNLKARVREWQSLTYTVRSNKPGTLELKLHKDAQGFDYLMDGNQVEVWRNGEAVWAGIIVSEEFGYDEAGAPSAYRVIGAYDFNILPYKRIVERPAGQDLRSHTGKVDDVMRQFVRDCLEPGTASASRAVTGFSVEADQSLHPDTKTLAGGPKDTLGGLLEKWADAYSVDWWIEASLGTSPSYTFRCKYPQRGSDRTDSVVFTINRKNVTKLRLWSDSVDKANYVYVGGPGEGAAQTVQGYYSGSSEPTGLDRWEAFVPAPDAQYADQLEVYGEAWLDAYGQPVTGVEFELAPSEAARWHSDWDVGDLVTVYDPWSNTTREAKVEEVTVAIGEDGVERISVVVGDPRPSKWELLQSRVGPYSSFNDQAPPDTPTGLSYSTGTYQDDQGVWHAKLELDWDDNSELDLAGYVAEIKRSGETKWQAQRVTESGAVFEGLELGGSYYARVKAIDRAGNESSYANFAGGSAIQMPTDTYAPATPTGLTVTAAKKAIVITVDKNTEKDWAGNEFHVSTTSGFTPNSSTLVYSGKATSYTYNCPTYDTYYVRVRAYDTSGNFSDYTDEASATPERVVGIQGDVGPNTIPDSAIIECDWAKITNVTIVDADIQNCSVNKLTTGGLSAEITVQSGGKIQVGGTFVIDDTAIKVYGEGSLRFYSSDGATYQTIYHDGAEIHAQGMRVDSTIQAYGGLATHSTVRPQTADSEYCGTDSLYWYVVSCHYLHADGIGSHLDGDVLCYDDFLPSSDNAYDCGNASRRWALVRGVTVTSGDLGFEEKVCPICGRAFKEGDELVLRVKKVLDDQILTVPMHKSCRRS